MKSRFSPLRTVRGRLLAAAIIVESIMLTLMVGNGMRLLYESLAQQAKAYASQMTPVLNAALVAPLAQRDYATIQAILDESAAVEGLDYLAVSDNAGKLVATSGWKHDVPLPPPDKEFSLTDKGGHIYRYDVAHAVTLAGQPLGRLYFGVNLKHIVEARKNLLMQGFAIALGEILLSAGILTLLGYWLTRHLTQLTRASEQVAKGNYSPDPVAEGEDDIGQLGAAFNAMSSAVRERVRQLTVAVSEQALLTHDLEEERARLMALLSSMEFGVLFVDINGQVVYVNPSFERIWALQCGAMGKTLTDLMRACGNRPSVDDLASLLEEGQDRLEMTLDNGRIVTAHRYPVMDGDQTSGWLYTFIDVTESRQAAHQLLAAKEQAESANRIKSEFLATMSHEIRTPMNGIIGMTGLLIDTPLGREQRHYTDTIRLSAEALLQVINDILDFSKMEAGRLELEDGEFEVLPLVEGVLDVLAPRLAGKNIDLLHYIAPEARGLFKGDSGRLRQVLLNLAGNAVKFTQSGSVVVRVFAESSAKQGQRRALRLRFVIEDTGIGIADSAKPRLFSMFTQADSTTARRFGGTGLGLAISKRIVDQMGGEIGFESQEGQGSLFWFTVDLPKLPGLGGGAEEPRHLTGTRILVVDDNAINREILNRQIAGWGAAVCEAEGAADALPMIRQAASDGAGFDLVVLDHHMPGMTGLDLAAILRADHALDGLAVIIASSGATEGLRPMAEGLRIQSVLLKPVREDNLRNALLSALGRASVDDDMSQGETDTPAPGHLTVLVADDNAINLQVAVGLLNKLGHRADVAGDGQEALTMVQNCAYDLILMDMQMPVMDGLEATRCIRGLGDNKAGVPIIAMTANAMQGDRDICLTAGMDDYIAKPIDRHRLAAVLGRWQQRLYPHGPANQITAAETTSSSTAPFHQPPAPHAAEALMSDAISTLSIADSIPVVDDEARLDLQDALGEDVLKRLMGALRRDLPVECAKMKDAVDRGDTDAMIKLAHALKGSASNLGFLRLAAALELLVHAGRNGGAGAVQAMDAVEQEQAAASALLEGFC